MPENIAEEFQTILAYSLEKHGAENEELGAECQRAVDEIVEDHLGEDWDFFGLTRVHKPKIVVSKKYLSDPDALSTIPSGQYGTKILPMVQTTKGTSTGGGCSRPLGVQCPYWRHSEDTVR